MDSRAQHSSMVKSQAEEAENYVEFIEADTELADWLTSGKVIVARFHQLNCAHCEKTESVFNQLAKDLSKDAVFLDVDVGGLNLSTLFKSRVFSLPTIEVWRDARLVGKVAGVEEDKVKRLVSKAVSEETDSEGEDSLSRSITQSMSASTQFIASLGNQILQSLQSARGMLSRTGSMNLDSSDVPHSHLSSPPSPNPPNSPNFLANAAQTLYRAWGSASGSRVNVQTQDEDWEQVDSAEVSIPLPPAVGSKKT